MNRRSFLKGLGAAFLGAKMGLELVLTDPEPTELSAAQHDRLYNGQWSEPELLTDGSIDFACVDNELVWLEQEVIFSGGNLPTAS